MAEGVPWDVAMHLSPARRLAFCVMFGERRGGVFNWHSMTWEKPPGSDI